NNARRNDPRWPRLPYLPLDLRRRRRRLFHLRNNRHSRHHQSRVRSTFLNRSNETVTPARQRLYVAGLIGGIPQHLSQSVHRRVQSVVEIDERTVFPEIPLKLISGDGLTGLPDESNQ